MITLDRIDRDILHRLQRNGDLPVSELAEQIGMSGPPCWRRVKRLKDAGIITQRNWHANPKALGLNVVVYATLRLRTHDEAATSAFRERVLDIPEIMECYILLGTTDVLVKIVTRDMEAYEEFYYGTLSKLPSVRETTSSVVMTAVKQTNILPMSQIPVR